MAKTNRVSSIPHVAANQCVENSAPVYIMKLVVKNIAGRLEISFIFAKLRIKSLHV